MPTLPFPAIIAKLYLISSRAFGLGGRVLLEYLFDDSPASAILPASLRALARRTWMRSVGLAEKGRRRTPRRVGLVGDQVGVGQERVAFGVVDVDVEALVVPMLGVGSILRLDVTLGQLLADARRRRRCFRRG